jgi:hypothetical protein
MNAIGLILVTAGGGVLLIAVVLIERARDRKFHGPRPTGDRLTDYELHRAELARHGGDGTACRSAE